MRVHHRYQFRGYDPLEANNIIEGVLFHKAPAGITKDEIFLPRRNVPKLHEELGTSQQLSKPEKQVNPKKETQLKG